MASIKPFLGIRPARESASKIAALPYDVYNRQEAKEIVAKNPMSFLRIDRAETNFPDSVDTYAEEVYAKAHDLLWEMIAKGDFIQDDAPCFYIYELTMDGRVQTGIVGCAAVDDYESGVIKRHENTRADKEADRIHHVDSCDAQTGPIFLAYRDNATIDEVVERVKATEAEYDFTSEDGIRHRVWVVGNTTDIATIQKTFAGIDEIYIADGHHRAASAVRVSQRRRAKGDGKEHEYDYFLSVLFPDNQLKILDYNRVVRDLNGYAPEELMTEIEEVADLVMSAPEAIHPQEKGQFAMYLGETWYLYSIKPELRSEDPVDGLDVALLQNLVLEPLLGIEDPKTDARIDFVGGIRGLEELERRCHADMQVAFAMYPTQISELFAVADANRLMPPKSTWFEPKLRSGLFIHSLKD